MTELSLTLTVEPDYIKKDKIERRQTLENRQQLNQFLAAIERRAFQIALISTRNPDDALELVQEAMLKLVEKYHSRPEEEWSPLFYRILSSKINDWYRKQNVRNRWLSWLPSRQLNPELNYDPIDNAKSPTKGPASELRQKEATTQLIKHLEKLSPRQQQAFLLRAWEGMSVEETAFAMKCSEGSVKTHYSRAIHHLREQLEEYRE
ncbi:RNA polymerase sigma factor [Pleionea sediminis]|uniref:RNA polymerase sigma factor n=1 Tax=Pleionea sediminis TaxID=2569479 RepID=UPI0011847431|nr:RNA polymerase sigma factor [Pleionea sediminis]